MALNLASIMDGYLQVTSIWRLIKDNCYVYLRAWQAIDFRIRQTYFMPIQTVGYVLNSLAYPHDCQFLEKEICIGPFTYLRIVSS